MASQTVTSTASLNRATASKRPVRAKCRTFPLQPDNHIAIIGGGFSGTLQAINLLRHGGPRATLIERSPDQLARGVAYSAAHPSHLLNVRAVNMSALPDHPHHFSDWFARRHGGSPTSFVSRRVYGDYIGELLDRARRAAPDRLMICAGTATDIIETHEGLRIIMKEGTPIDADAVVLAIGNLPPHSPPHVNPEALGEDRYASDPWAADIADELGDRDEVLLIGTGLTAVDAALLLDARGFRGAIHALSRRGLMPRMHDPRIERPAGVRERPTGRLSEIVGSVRERGIKSDWRVAVDELRPQTQNMWLAADVAARGRFVRHLRPYWDVHRHRLAPAVATAIEALRESGRLRPIAGKIIDASHSEPGVLVSYRPRGDSRTVQLPVRRMVNCTGPQGDITRSREPIIANLVEKGLIRADSLRLGIDVDSRLRVIGSIGKAHPRIYAIGPMTRGAFWEMVAVPDLREQAWALARRLSNSHWIGGEGL